MTTNSKSCKLKPKSQAQILELKEDLNEKKRLGYADSTQFKHWLFASQSMLTNKRLESLSNQITKLKQDCPDFDRKYAQSIPTESEYFASLSYFCKEIIEICRKFKFPHYVSCTAVTYFKRFYLSPKCNLVRNDAMVLKDACIYLASKCEQSLFQSIQQLTAVTKTVSEHVINNELVLMDAISFHLKVWNPFRSFRSFLNDFKLVWKKKHKRALSDTYEQRILTQGFELIQDSFISDVCLLFTPSQIALSCLLLVVGNLSVPKSKSAGLEKDLSELKRMSVSYFDFRFESNAAFERLKQTTKEIQRLVIGAIRKCNMESNKALQKQSNTKVYALQNLYWAIVRQKQSEKKVKSVRAKVSQNGSVKKEKKKKFRLKVKRKGGSKGSTTAPPPVKRTKNMNV